MQQQIFDFARSHLAESWDRLDRFIAGHNAPVLRMLNDWLDDPHNQHAYLFGGKLSGCTRLLHACCRHLLEQGHGAAVIDSPLALLNGEQLALVERNHLLAIDGLELLGVSSAPGCPPERKAEIEEALYELYDRARDTRCALLFAGHAPVSGLSIGLKDLRTRMTSCLQLALRPLKDEGLEQLAEQLLREYGVTHVPQGLGRLVLTYCTRDSANVVGFIRTIHLVSLNEHKPILSLIHI